MPIRYTLKLAHINDTHSHFDSSSVRFNYEDEGKSYDIYTHSGGYARLNYQINTARAQAQTSKQAFLFLHGGDSFQGSLYFNQFKGAANAHLLNLLKPDAMVIGNHEVDAGSAPILAFLDSIQFPLLAGNMDLSQECTTKSSVLKGHKNLYEYHHEKGIAKVVFKPLQDKKLAIIGITLDQMAEIARPDPDTHFIDAIETTRNTVNALKAEGIDHILVLSHLGFDQDKVLAEAVDGISLIVGGHSHTLQGEFKEFGLSSTPYGVSVNNTPILHAGKHAETIGLADIEFDEVGMVTSLKGHNLFMLDSQFILESKHDISQGEYDRVYAHLKQHPGITWDDEDCSVTQVINTQYKPAITALEQTVLGFVPKNLVHTRLPSKALPHGSEIAPLVCKSIFHESKHQLPRVDFALHNAGGVRQSLNKGEVTLAYVVGRLLPFDLPLVHYEIQGTYLFAAIESAINSATNNSVTGTGAGSFPYTYGLKYCYDGRKALGERVLSLEVLAEDGLTWLVVDKETYYFGVSSAYTVSGKEGYGPLLQAKTQKPINELTLPLAFTRYMERQQGNLEDEIAPQVHYTSHL
ncbi:bifunctional metallophosphatase/5'-nucleotidase [Shewanella nanhaiensis]|uniref:5'-nucleotidase C-terminal domain-containing protein n=1 Tax=Shewanella nanhaiensis TaxID=2864872 RepID=A0ABS7E973_9GAMM|nr:5'-nucleotidase C-terminal domain-containing protein [Shewanella nanhaiensis]MBW8186227.1 5'-nucleotidase C-terminal domain-containing protein [Shewanella nanhaiensis]